MAPGVLTQGWGLIRPQATFAHLASGALGWPRCPRAGAATALLVLEASVLPRDDTETCSPLVRHRLCWGQRASVEGGERATGPSQWTPAGTLKVGLNRSSAAQVETAHPCRETREQTPSSRSDLLDKLLDSPEVQWFRDGRFREVGKGNAGGAMVRPQAVTEAEALPPRT